MTMTDRTRGPRGARAIAAAVVLTALAGCAAAPPNDVAQGVGFGDYEAYQARRAALNAAPALPPRTAQTALPPADVAAEPFAPRPAEPLGGVAWAPVGTSTGGTDVASLASAAIAEAERESVGPTATMADPGAPGLPPVTASGDNFRAPPLPEGMAVLGANVVAFALSTDHAVGERVWGRFPLRLGRPEVRCGDFRTTDLAQDWFLTNEGPERDRAGLDPDGDGFACNWDPERYRAEARAASMPRPPVPAAGTPFPEG
jgi:hypothetical protein